MIYNNVRHECNLYNFFFAPRGNRRVMELGMKITQMYLNPFDRIIGIIGAKDSGKSMLIKGMFPGIQTVEEDDEFDILNMPLLNSDDVGFYTPRTFHVDVRADHEVCASGAYCRGSSSCDRAAETGNCGAF